MTIKGILIEQSEGHALCRIQDFTENLQDIIRAELSAIAYGTAQASSLPDYYSYQNTLINFLDRYKKKSEDTQKGMIGELLSHILIPILFKNLTSLSILFNKEERSIKKGFDIVYCDFHDESIWYSEVKSGHRSKRHTANVANITLLNRAHTDLKDKLKEGRNSLWDSALFDVQAVLSESKAQNAKSLLSADSPLVRKSALSDDKNAILVSVLYECPQNPFLIESLKTFFTEVEEIGDFKNTLVFSIQKKTYEKVAEFLEKEASNV